MDASRHRERFERALLLWLREGTQSSAALHLRAMAMVCVRQSQVPRPAALEPLFWRDAAQVLEVLAQQGTDTAAHDGEYAELRASRQRLVAALAEQALSLWRQGPRVPCAVPVSLLGRLRDAHRVLQGANASWSNTAEGAGSPAEGALMRADEASLALSELMTHLDAATLADPASDILPRARSLARELLDLSVALSLQPLADLMELELCLLGADPLAHAAALAEGANEARHALHRFAAGTLRAIDARVLVLMQDALERSQQQARG